MTSLLGIGEFSRRVGLSVSAVRFYGDRDLLAPAETDPANGYRQYRPDQIATGRLIRDLRRIGLPLSEVRRALAMAEPEVMALVEAYLHTLEVGLAQARAIASSLGSDQHAAMPDQPAADRGFATAGTRVSGVELRQALEQVLPFAATDPEWPQLMTVLIEIDARAVRIAATDRHRLAVRELVAAGPGQETATLVAAASVRRLVRDLVPLGEVSLQAGPAGLVVSDADLADRDSIDAERKVVFPCVPAVFPDYKRFLQPATSTVGVVVERAGLLDALAGFCRGGGPVSLSVVGDEFRIDRGGVSAVLAIDDTGGEISVAIDPEFAADAASSAIGPEVVIEIGPDPANPVLFRSATDGTYVSLVMPVKLT